ncbi:TetR/AcrR family transcriptional regulator [Actinomadura harenae]|uniref:TetR/AcrR family transcriptional regulator n=1 Tax=Actinomadura harenae TaxID=2483351 RepID=UPI0011C49827|nr:TetR/AcrR family transcriptional regulator C-terminal domain-containing protein [Actinomadura harenae]
MPRKTDVPRRRHSLWERLESQQSGLSHDRIGRAAARIADADGLEAVSMRRIGEELGAATMALYRYVDSKDDVLGLMLNLAYGEIEVPPELEGWRAILRALARELRGMHLRHAWAGQVQAITASGFAPNVLAVNEIGLAALDGLGLPPEAMMTALATLTAYVEGMVAEQVSMRLYLRRQGFESEDDFHQAYPDAFAPYVQWIFGQADRYPTVIRLMTSGYTEDYERSFADGLESVLDGLASRYGI